MNAKKKYKHLNVNTISIILFSFSLVCGQCRSAEEADIIEPRPDEVKSTYLVEGLDDSFYKEYEAHTFYDIDTTSDGDTASYFYIELSNKDRIKLTLYFEEAFQPRIYQEGSGNLEFLGTMEFDNIFCVIDSGYFEVKTIKDNVITASVDLIGYAGGGRKNYRMTGNNITASSKGYIIPE